MYCDVDSTHILWLHCVHPPDVRTSSTAVLGMSDAWPGLGVGFMLRWQGSCSPGAVTVFNDTAASALSLV